MHHKVYDKMRWFISDFQNAIMAHGFKTKRNVSLKQTQ